MVISATCATGRRLGLYDGMALSQAQAMMPDLAVFASRPDGDAAALERLAGWCLRYTPFTRAEPPDGIWLDLSGCAHLLGGETALLSDMAARLHGAGLSARAAVAPTPGAAHAMARHAPDALCSVPEDALEAVLASLPVDALRLDDADAGLLRRFGLHRIGMLMALPRGPLTRRLGMRVLQRLDQALGRLPEPIVPELPSAPAMERLEFAEPINGAESLLAATEELVRRLCERLEESCMGARRLELLFVRLDNSSTVQTVTLASASHAGRLINRLLAETLDRVDPGDGIEAMWLTARVAEPVFPAQQRWHGDPPAGAERWRNLAPLIDTLVNRLGIDRVWRPVPVESDVPERSLRRMPLHVLPDDPKPETSDGMAWPASLPRPVRLFDPPQPVLALAELPDQPPTAFTWRRHRHRVCRADGPERIAGEWWRRSGEMFALRDYFLVEDETGRRFWLFRRGNGTDPVTGDLCWFLHGLF